MPDWDECKGLAEKATASLATINRDMPQDFNCIEDPSDSDTVTIVYLSKTGSSRVLSLLFRKVEIHPSSPWECNFLSGQSLINPKSLSSSELKLSKEELLRQERQRVKLSGITSYEFDKIEGRASFLFSYAQKLWLARQKEDTTELSNSLDITCLTPDSKSAPLNATFCPGLKTCSFLMGDNIFVCNESGKLSQLTKFDRLTQNLSAGTPSYVIQEEFSRYQGTWWCPHAPSDEYTMLAYEVNDENDVPFSYIVQQDLGQNPSLDKFHFPKPGDPNPVSQLRLVKIVDDKPNKYFHLPTWGISEWNVEYLLRVEWVCKGYLLAFVCDRLQKNIALILIDIASLIEFDTDDNMDDVEPQNMEGEAVAAPKIILQSSNADYWINIQACWCIISSSLVYTSNELKFDLLWADEVDSGYNHLSLVRFHFRGQPNDGLISRIPFTSGNDWLVDNHKVWIKKLVTNVGISEEFVFYVSNLGGPTEANLFAKSLSSTTASSIQITDGDYYHSIGGVFSVSNEKCALVIDSRSSTIIKPHVIILRVDFDGESRLKSTPIALFDTFSSTGLFDSLHLSSEAPPASEPTSSSSTSLNKVSYPTDPSWFVRDFINAPLPAVCVSAPIIFSYSSEISGKTHYGMCFPPAKFSSGATYTDPKLPTLLFVYGGPACQLVTRGFKLASHLRLATLAAAGIPVIMVDCQGSAERGFDWEKPLYQNLGKFEIEQQIEGVTYAANHIFPFIDLDRVAIHGWSYGGYLAVVALATRADFFKIAISGAPVTDWRHYDSAYTERYMGLPTNQPDCPYETSSVLNMLTGLPDQHDRLFLIHGLQDENVHFVHTALLVDALIQSCKPHNVAVFPSEHHGIRNAKAYEFNFATLLHTLLNKL